MGRLLLAGRMTVHSLRVVNWHNSVKGAYIALHLNQLKNSIPEK